MPRTKTRWGDREARRADILRAARQLLEQKGYRAFNLRDLGRRAGVTAATVYTYYANKEELFATLYAERLDQLHAAIAPLAATLPAERLFLEIATRYLPIYRTFGRELDLWSSLADGRKSARPVIGAATRLLTTIAAALDRLGVAEARLALPLLWATLTGLCDQFVGPRHALLSTSWDELARFTAQTLMRGLATQPRVAAKKRSRHVESSR